jgi:hypothetical protein
MMYWKHYEDGTELLIVWGLGGVRPGVEKGVVVLLENILFHR